MSSTPMGYRPAISSLSCSLTLRPAAQAHVADNGSVPSRDEIVTFHDPPVPAGASSWVAGTEPPEQVEVVEPDPAWAVWASELDSRILVALGWRVLCLSHIGSTSVPGLPAKPIVDLDLIVADPGDEAAYVPALEAVGFELRVREPWWYGHRGLRMVTPKANVHVFGYDSPEPIKHRLFGDWLRQTSLTASCMPGSNKRQRRSQASEARA